MVNPYIQVSFIGEDWEQQLLSQQGQQGQPQRPVQRTSSYSSETRQPQRTSRTPPGPNCDPSVMNGNGPPRGLTPVGPQGDLQPSNARLRPPNNGGPRQPSAEPGGNRPPNGPPPRLRGSRTPLSPEEMALRRASRQPSDANAAQSGPNSYVRDCFIIPQQSVERFLPDGIAVSTLNLV